VTGAGLEIVSVEDQAAFWDDRATVAACMEESPPRIPAWFGYDSLGSHLFEAITELPSYYLTRVERELLRRNAAQIAELINCRRLAELGSGSAKKTRLLLSACLQRGPTTYLPIDVSREMLEISGATLTAELPGLTVLGLWGRYEAALGWLRDRSREPLVVALLGSNLGNATSAERDALLREIAATLRPGDGFLVSVDLHKSTEILEACYNDPPHCSAFVQFRLNHLAHLNRRFGADFVLDNFRSRAHYDLATAVVEAHLYAAADQIVSLPGLDLVLRLRHGQSINVGFSAKFHHAAFVADIAMFDLVLQAQWIDPVWQYGIFLFRRA